MKFENNPAHHSKEHNNAGTIQTTFLDKFKPISNKPGQKRHQPQCSKDIMVLYPEKIIIRKIYICLEEIKMKLFVLTLRFWLKRLHVINNDEKDNKRNNAYYN